MGPSGAEVKMTGKSLEEQQLEQSGSTFTQRDKAKEHIKPFLKEYRALGHHGQATRNLSCLVPHFLEFLHLRGIDESQINLQSAYDYQLYLIERGRRDGKPYKASTVRSYIKAAAAYTAWLKDTKRLLSNPFTIMRKIPEGQSLPKDLLKEADMGEYLENLADFNAPQSFKKRLRQYRTHIMAETLYASGVRLSELADIRLKDLDLPGGRIFIQSGKGGSSRYVFLTEYSTRILRLYIHRIRPLIIRYFPSVDQSRLFLCLSTTLVHTLNKSLRDKAEITVHKVRHTLGYHLLRAGCPLRYIQQILGHAHIRTSEVYTKVDGEKLGEMLISCHPRSHRLTAYHTP